MRVPTRPAASGVGLNMTPMIDVVFLLIIFFLVSSHLAQRETRLELPLPTSTTGVEPAPSPPPRVTINVLADGQVLAAGRPVAVSDLAAALREKRAAASSQLEVRIRSDRRAPYRAVSPVLLACARAGVWNVSFAVYRPEDVR